MSQVKLTADSGGGTTSLKAPSSTTSNADVVLKLPVADGSSGQVLKTDGSGQLSFTSNAGTTINNNADNRIITGSGTANTLEGEANCTFNGDSLGLNSSSTTEINLQYSNNTRLKIHVGSNFTQFLTQNDVPLLFKTDTGTGSGTEHLRITSAGKVGIGTSSPSGGKLHIAHGNEFGLYTSGGYNYQAKFESTDAEAAIVIEDNGSTNDGNRIGVISDVMAFTTANSERMRIDSSGNVGIGTSTPGGLVDIVGSANDTRALLIRNTNNSGGSAHAKIEISGGDNATAILKLECNGQNHEILEDGNGNLRIEDNDSERMRLRGATGGLMLGDDGGNRIGEPQLHVQRGGSGNNVASFFFNTTDDRDAIFIRHNGADGGNNRKMIAFLNADGNSVGTITANGSSTSYNTSSDYRLKENVTAISDGITRLKTLKPYRFNFKDNPSKTVDGFFAHEVTAVPEAITGAKDETENILYRDGDEIPEGKNVGDIKETVAKYQSIDQAKLVPLLTAALQEEVGKREALETRVAALEAA